LRWRDLTIQHVDISHDTDGHDPRVVHRSVALSSVEGDVLTVLR
jgi:hypothetical protein